ncbi:glycosyltransferase [Carboxylicivirga marina]|uniref:glycosyltransferase n=1 Tax=Carboxylicivirga marina TaxID=2800988 RepID=UPI00259166E8|nr:glycosyltransferase [uncultured Carboxylicivirga sp.]
MTETPDITVIMGIYNAESTLEEALDSLLSQTYKKFKVILCDDCSVDDTYELARSYVDKFSEWLLIKNEQNKGLSYTLNKCLQQVDTEYVARMDADDVSLPTRFEKQVTFLKANPEIAIVSSPMVYFDEGGDFKTGKAKEYPMPMDFVAGSPFAHAPCMVRRKAYERVNGYSENFRRGQDYHLWFKMYEAGFRGYNFKEPLYKMRDDTNAMNRRKFKYRIDEMRMKQIGYRMLSLPFYYQVFAFKPILVGLLPKWMYKFLHKL